MAIKVIIWKSEASKQLTMVPVSASTRHTIETSYKANNDQRELRGGMVCFENKLEIEEALEHIQFEDQKAFEAEQHTTAFIPNAVYRVWVGSDGLDLTNCI